MRAALRRSSCGVGLVGFVGALAFAAAVPSSLVAQEIVVGGRVYDPASGDAGIENARVFLEPHGSTLSGGDGTFSFRGVRAGEYRLRVEAFGYEELELPLSLSSDTTLLLPLRADPIELDSVNVRLERLDFDGTVRDPRTRSWVADAEILSDQGHRETSNLFGRFELDDVFDGPPLRLTIRAFRYLPLDTALIPDDEERHVFDMAPDPVMSRMIDAYEARLDDRAGDLTYEYQPALNREDLARFSANASLRQIMERKYPLHILRRIGCFFLDEREYRFHSDGERISVFEGTVANDLERIELLEIPGEGRYIMARIYTRHFFQRQVGSPDELDRPSMVAVPGGFLCR